MIFIANFFDVVETFPSIFITVLALYIYFEIFCDNVKRKIMKNIGYKLVDFFYVMFFEYSFSLFLIDYSHVKALVVADICTTSIA